MRKNSIHTLLIATIIFFSIPFFSGCSKENKSTSSKSRVALSAFVLYDIASFIAQDTLDLIKIIPAGVDIHAYEPTPKMVAKMHSSDLLLINGMALEPWLRSHSFKSKLVSMDSFFEVSSFNAQHTHDEHTHKCSHSSLDPHIWFDIQKMKKMAEVISSEFIKLEPSNEEVYKNNKEKYIQMLDTLDETYKVKLHSCKRKIIITDHNAFSYLSLNYGFEIKSLTGLSPDSEASPKDMIRIIKDIKRHNVAVVFFENFGSDKAMKNIAQQANIKIQSLHPLGNITKDDIEKKHNYEDIMLENLDKIADSLECH